MIVHLRVVPGFGVAVEEIRRPQLRSVPTILDGLPHQRGTVREANFLAQRRGIQAGMSLSQAHQQCPDGMFLAPDLPRYETVWASICDILRTYTPLVEPLELGQAVCDLSGCDRLWGGAHEAARAIAAQIHHATGVAPWLGVASNRLVAGLASTGVGPDGVSVVEPGGERAFLADLPLALLPEIDTRLALTFQVLGLRTIGQFAALPLPSIKGRFGARGERLHRYARGVDPRPVQPPREKPRVSARRDCEDGTIEEAAEVLHGLADSCAAELQHRSLAGTMIELSLELASPSIAPRAALPPRSDTENDTPRSPLPRPAETGHQDALPIPYRIHSMLPQPGAAPPLPATDSSQLPVTPHETLVREGIETVAPVSERPLPSIRARTTVRTPVDTASRLLEVARHLLVQHWREGMRAHALELTVSEFPAPRQLAFSELNSIAETGRLAGPSSERLQALAEGERVLASRYGDASFRHVGGVEPGNILTERRFRWRSGLPWDVP